MQLIGIILFSFYAAAILLLLAGLIRLKWKNCDGGEPKRYEKVSVIIAFRNESRNMPNLIKSIAAQDLDQNYWEVILVDDHSEDDGLSIAMSRVEGLPIYVYSLPEGVKGKKNALLYGLSKAVNDVVAITDADCVHPNSWLRMISLEMGSTDFLQGEVRPLVESNSLISWFEALDYASLMAVSAASFALHRPVIAASANLAFNRKVVPANSYSIRVDVPSGDDMFMLHSAKRLKGTRLKFLSSNKIAVRSRFEGGWEGFIGRRIRWASKSKSYSDIDTIVLAALVFAINAWLVVLLLASALGFTSITLPLTFWLWKTLVDFTFLLFYLVRTDQVKLLAVFLPLQVVYPFYITVTALVGLIKGVSWKGRASI